MNTLKLRHFGSPSGGRFFGRAIGAAMRERIESILATVPVGETFALDLTGVEFIDYTFADEAIAILLKRLTGGEYGDRFLVLKADETDESAALLENIEVAVQRRELAVLVSCVPDKWRVLGELAPHLKQTLAVAMSVTSITASQVREVMNIEGATATTNRMHKLAALRLVKKRETVIPIGGSQLIYSGIV